MPSGESQRKTLRTDKSQALSPVVPSPAQRTPASGVKKRRTSANTSDSNDTKSELGTKLRQRRQPQNNSAEDAKKKSKSKSSDEYKHSGSGGLHSSTTDDHRRIFLELRLASEGRRTFRDLSGEELLRIVVGLLVIIVAMAIGLNYYKMYTERKIPPIPPRPFVASFRDMRHAAILTENVDCSLYLKTLLLSKRVVRELVPHALACLQIMEPHTVFFGNPRSARPTADEENAEKEQFSDVSMMFTFQRGQNEQPYTYNPNIANECNSEPTDITSCISIYNKSMSSSFRSNRDDGLRALPRLYERMFLFAPIANYMPTQWKFLYRAEGKNESYHRYFPVSKLTNALRDSALDTKTNPILVDYAKRANLVTEWFTEKGDTDRMSITKNRTKSIAQNAFTFFKSSSMEPVHQDVRVHLHFRSNFSKRALQMRFVDGKTGAAMAAFAIYATTSALHESQENGGGPATEQKMTNYFYIAYLYAQNNFDNFFDKNDKVNLDNFRQGARNAIRSIVDNNAEKTLTEQAKTRRFARTSSVIIWKTYERDVLVVLTASARKEGYIPASSAIIITHKSKPLLAVSGSGSFRVPEQVALSVLRMIVLNEDPDRAISNYTVYKDLTIGSKTHGQELCSGYMPGGQIEVGFNRKNNDELAALCGGPESQLVYNYTTYIERFDYRLQAVKKVSADSIHAAASADDYDYNYAFGG